MRKFLSLSRYLQLIASPPRMYGKAIALTSEPTCGMNTDATVIRLRIRTSGVIPRFSSHALAGALRPMGSAAGLVYALGGCWTRVLNLGVSFALPDHPQCQQWKAPV